MRLFERINIALHKAVDKEGSQVNLSKKTGISASIISLFYGKRRDASNMTIDTLERLFPEMRIFFFKNEYDSGLSILDKRFLKLTKQLNDNEKESLSSCLATELIQNHSLKCLLPNHEGLPAANADEYSKLIMKKLSGMNVQEKLKILSEVEKICSASAHRKVNKSVSVGVENKAVG